MSSPSNLYAEKIFSEHPLGLWALDEQLDYVSLITNAEREPYNWTTAVNCTITPIPLPVGEYPATPPLSSEVTAIIADAPTGDFLEFGIASNPLTPNFDQSKDTFSLGAYIFVTHPFGVSVQIGYSYLTTTGQAVQDTKYFTSVAYNNWIFISETFDTPSDIAPGTFQIVIRGTYANGALPEYPYLVHGVTMGQWNEEFNSTSLGLAINTSITADTVASCFEASDTAKYLVNASAYSFDGNYGYYLSSENKLMATNSSIPMVFGSSNLTELYPNNNKPSLIIPADGFLGEEGRYRQYTLEFWARIATSSNTARKIVGPISSNDGIYVDKSFIRLQIGNQSASHFVAAWYRPMLMHLKIGDGNATLLIDGESTLSIEYDQDNIALPSEFTNSISNDWIGFYAYDDVPTFEIDSVSLFSYKVSEILAKRRFGYGQAVESPEGANKAFGGNPSFIDYKFADYTNNYLYPDIGKWDQGISENILVEDNIMQSPRYGLPSIVFNNSNLETFFETNEPLQIAGSELFTTFNGNDGYFQFDDFNMLRPHNIKGIYGFFGTGSKVEEEKLLFKIQNKINGNYLKLVLKYDYLVYKLAFNGPEETLYEQYGVVEDSLLFAGINIDGLREFFGGNVESLLRDTNQLKIYVASDESFSQPFDGKIYKIGLCTSRNFAKIQNLLRAIDPLPGVLDAGDSYFGNDPTFWAAIVDAGVLSEEYSSEVIDGGDHLNFWDPEYDSAYAALYAHTASYTLKPYQTVNGTLYFDIKAESYWEDYIPLSYFAQYVQDIFGKYYYDLDFIQYNIAYPAPIVFTNGNYDTSSSNVKTYITFQYLSTGANAQPSYFTNTVAASRDGIVRIGAQDPWLNTKYEVVDGTVIYPPKGVNVNQLAIVTHVEMITDGTTVSPIKIRKMEYASQAFNNRTSNPIGTRFGSQIFPYTKYSSYFDYKSYNPYRIYKQSTPYLYLTNDSGIERLGEVDPLITRGFLIPVNQNAASEYRVIAMQSFIRHNNDEFSDIPVKIFEIQGTEDYLQFFMVANGPDKKRARIYAISAKTGSTQTGVAYYVNGKLVREPVIGINSWTSLGIGFAQPLVFDEYAGAIRFTGPLLVNNVSYYESSSLQELQRQSKNVWFTLSLTDWQDVLGINAVGGSYTWKEVLVISTISYFGINPEDIYKAYTGTNKIISDDSRAVSFTNAEYKLLTGVKYDSYTISPI